MADEATGAAFDVIVLQYQARIARHILRLVGDPELALDLTQETFVSAFRKIHTLRSQIALSAWLFKIATNHALNALTRSRQIPTATLADLENSPLLATDAPDSVVMDRELVQFALNQLPRDRAACLLLHLKEGFTYDEVAIIVGTSPEAVRKRIARAKDQFRAIYDAHIEDSVSHAVR